MNPHQDVDGNGESREAWLAHWQDVSGSPVPMQFLVTTEATDLVVDLWEREDAAPGSWERITVVVTMRKGIGLRPFEYLPFFDWGVAASVAVAWDGVLPTPRERLLEAIWQGHLRALDRQSDAQFHQVWPPT
jgi:hypothetical protein